MGMLDPVVALLDRLAESIDPNGQFRREKLLTMVGYAFVSALTFVYAFAGGGPLISNELGANIENHEVKVTGEQWFLIQNTSSSDWTSVNMVLNDNYYYIPLKPIAASATERVFVKDFAYRNYIPRPPRVSDWANLSTTERPGANAPRDLKPATLMLKTNEGEFTALFQGAIDTEPEQDDQAKEKPE